MYRLVTAAHLTNLVVSENGIGEEEESVSMRTRLKHAKVPLCRANNQVRTHIERMLRHRLSFPRSLATDYSGFGVAG